MYDISCRITCTLAQPQEFWLKLPHSYHFNKLVSSSRKETQIVIVISLKPIYYSEGQENQV